MPPAALMILLASRRRHGRSGEESLMRRVANLSAVTCAVLPQASQHAQRPKDQHLSTKADQARSSRPICRRGLADSWEIPGSHERGFTPRNVTNMRSHLLVKRFNFVQNLSSISVVFCTIHLSVFGCGASKNTVKSGRLRLVRFAPYNFEHEFTREHSSNRSILLSGVNPKHSAEISGLDDAPRTKPQRGVVIKHAHGCETARFASRSARQAAGRLLDGIEYNGFPETAR